MIIQEKHPTPCGCFQKIKADDSGCLIGQFGGFSHPEICMMLDEITGSLVVSTRQREVERCRCGGANQIKPRLQQSLRRLLGRRAHLAL